MKYYFSKVTPLLLLVICLMACQERKTYQLSPMSVTVSESSGDDYADQDQAFLPIPVNRALIDHNGERIETFILSKQVSVGTNIGILPFKEVHYRDAEGEDSKILIAFPSDESLVLSNNDAQQLDGDKLYAAIHIIEYWYTHRDGLNGKHKVQERSVSYEDYID